MMMDFDVPPLIDITWQVAYSSPGVDITLFRSTDDATSRRAAIIGWLRRQTIWSEYDGTIIGYRYAPIAVGQEIMNMIHRSIVESFDDIVTRNKTTLTIYRSSEEWIERNILNVTGRSHGFVPALDQPDLDNYKYIEFPTAVNMGDCIMPSDQEEMMKHRTLDNIITLDRRIVDAIVFDNNVVFVMGSKAEEVVYIGKLLQNEFINCIFIDEYMNVLAANTYTLRKEEELWYQRPQSTQTL